MSPTLSESVGSILFGRGFVPAPVIASNVRIPLGSRTACREVWSATTLACPGAAVTDASPTLGDLLDRFELRRRATAAAFHAGVRLARMGAVHLQVVADDVVLATVRDEPPAHVELRVAGHRIIGGCSWAEPGGPCQHQAAVAHELWVRARRGS